jgi:hypothetical protein
MSTKNRKTRKAMEQFAFRLPPEEGRRLRRRARREKVTPSAVIRAAWREYDAKHAAELA